MAQLQSGATSASLLVLVLVATAVGALAGLSLDGTVTATRTLAIIAGLLAVIVASIARYKVVFLGAGVGTESRACLWFYWSTLLSRPSRVAWRRTI